MVARLKIPLTILDPDFADFLELTDLCFAKNLLLFVDPSIASPDRSLRDGSAWCLANRLLYMSRLRVKKGRQYKNSLRLEVRPDFLKRFNFESLCYSLVVKKNPIQLNPLTSMLCLHKRGYISVAILIYNQSFQN